MDEIGTETVEGWRDTTEWIGISSYPYLYFTKIKRNVNSEFCNALPNSKQVSRDTQNVQFHQNQHTFRLLHYTVMQHWGSE